VAVGPILNRVDPRHAARVDVTRPALGTWIRVVARHPDRDRASRAVARAYAAIDAVDREMSLHRPDSDLVRVNRAAGSAAVPVPAALLEVVALACEGARRSEGVYDPSVLPLLRLFGFYGPERSDFPSDRHVARARARVGWGAIQLDRTRGTLGLERPGAGLDLGSIGKGWAVDRAAEAMRASGVAHGLVDAGGNIFAFGDARDGDTGWSVGVFHPVTGGVDRVFVLRDSAIATSGNYEQSRVLAGRRVGHLFDAVRGRPSNDHLSASVLARNAVDADRMSTASFLLGPDRFHWPEALDVHFVG
jgi:thiamine biosynthesis lipoprotein